MNWTLLAVIAGVAILFIGWKIMQQARIETITTDEVVERMRSDTSVVILDVRTEAEFSSSTGHLKNAILIPVQELSARMDEMEQFKEKTIIAVCRSGNRSGRATIMMNEQGYTVLNMQGGMIKWNAEGLPVVHQNGSK